jgi:hypothetical protein
MLMCKMATYGSVIFYMIEYFFFFDVFNMSLTAKTSHSIRLFFIRAKITTNVETGTET